AHEAALQLSCKPAPGTATTLASLTTNVLAVATTFDASENVALRYAAVVGDEPSMTHTSRPPSTPLTARNPSRPRRCDSRGRIASLLFDRPLRLFLQHPGGAVVRVQRQRPFGRAHGELRLALAQRAAAKLDQRWNTLPALPAPRPQPVHCQQ